MRPGLDPFELMGYAHFQVCVARAWLIPSYPNKYVGPGMLDYKLAVAYNLFKTQYNQCCIGDEKQEANVKLCHRISG